MPMVLVADDNAKIVDVLVEYLTSAGFETKRAHDGSAAFRIIKESAPDLAVLDVMMPGMDGLELTRHCAERNIPVILVTARKDEVDRLIGLDVGADDYVTKPFSPREVVARVRAVLRRAGRLPAEFNVTGRHEVDDLVVDVERRTVVAAGRPVELTRTEFEIVHALIQRPGRVFSRLQLMEASSGDSFEGYERTIDAHIKNIRHKLGEERREFRWIQTVFGVGYKMAEPVEER